MTIQVVYLVTLLGLDILERSLIYHLSSLKAADTIGNYSNNFEYKLTWYYTNNGKLLVEQNIVRNGSLRSNVVFEKEVNSYNKSVFFLSLILFKFGDHLSQDLSQVCCFVH